METTTSARRVPRGHAGIAFAAALTLLLAACAPGETGADSPTEGGADAVQTEAAPSDSSEDPEDSGTDGEGSGRDGEDSGTDGEPPAGSDTAPGGTTNGVSIERETRPNSCPTDSGRHEPVPC
ncbi:hypothetical protein ER308_14010 [Egibacter rhizosphaerae]|uniref:Uncharacterized protein n=1 Tax=Egibacter rhizosphaerae TaxID=1670831 RepID=A0A411YGW6_9ACTN|nr:hypothetical protein [Egibacter rhizosphaerae]QBI20565.1 hypothetical protein ER308_14010 [Egibacter rhizosphaerae]